MNATHVLEKTVNGISNAEALRKILEFYFPYDKAIVNNVLEGNFTVNGKGISQEVFETHMQRQNLVQQIIDDLEDSPFKLEQFIATNRHHIEDDSIDMVYVLYTGNNHRLKDFKNVPLKGCIRDINKGVITYKGVIKFPLEDCLCSKEPIHVVPPQSEQDVKIDLLSR